MTVYTLTETVIFSGYNNYYYCSKRDNSKKEIEVVSIKRPKIKEQTKTINLLKTMVINLFSLTLLAGLIVCFFTQKTPWLLGKPSPSVVTETRLVELFNDEISLPTGLNSVDDNGNILASLHTETSGTSMQIKADGTTEKSASIILKESSLFIYADDSHQIWLHRSQKMLQTYDKNNEILWEHHFENWPENAWASSDAFVLTSHREDESNRVLTLFDDQGSVLWTHAIHDMEPQKAYLAPEGQGALVFSKITASNSDYNARLIGPEGMFYEEIFLSSLPSYTGAISPDGQKAYLSGGRELYSLGNPELKLGLMFAQAGSGSTVEGIKTPFNLPAYANLIKVNEKNNEIIVACWDDINKTGSLLYLNSKLQVLWERILEEKLINLSIHNSGLAIYGGSPNVIFAYTNQGSTIWAHHMIEANLVSLAFSGNGRYVAAIDSNQKVILWQVP